MKHTGFTLSRNEWLVMEALWEHPSTLMELVRQLAGEAEADRIRSAIAYRH